VEKVKKKREGRGEGQNLKKGNSGKWKRIVPNS